MTLHGAAYAPASPHAARAAGVAMVFQHFSLFDALNVAENVALGMENPPRCATLAQRIREVSRDLRPAARSGPAGGRSVGGRTPAGRDHPLPAAGPEAADHGRADQRADPAGGRDPVRDPAQAAAPKAPRSSISRTSWKKSAALCDSATILRLGKVVGDLHPARNIGPRDGRDDGRPGAAHARSRGAKEPGEVVLELSGACRWPRPTRSARRCKTCHVEVRPGEVLGIGGVAGNGQDELLAALSGEIAAPPDAMRLCRAADRPAWAERAAQAGPADRARGTAGPCRGPGYEPDRERPADRRGPRGPGDERLSELGQGARLCREDHRGLRRAHPRAAAMRRGRCRAATCRNS